jgi:hypothetical protein
MVEYMSIYLIDDGKRVQRGRFGIYGILEYLGISKFYLVLWGIICMFNLGLELDRVNV